MVTLDQAGAGIPALRLLPVPRGLEGRVEGAWTEAPLRGPHSAHSAWRIVPDASAHLLYHRLAPPGGGDLRHRLVVSGPRTRAVDVDKTRRALTVGVRLRPWAVPTLLDVPADAIADRTTSLEAVIGPAAGDLEARLQSASPEGAVEILGAWIGERGASRETTDERRAREAVSSLRRRDPCGRAARIVGIGSRRLRSLLRERVGLAPKTLARVARLHDALRRVVRSAEDVAWARVAASSGYYDQAHMIREFRSLLGETPGAWRARGRARPLSSS